MFTTKWLQVWCAVLSFCCLTWGVFCSSIFFSDTAAVYDLDDYMKSFESITSFANGSSFDVYVTYPHVRLLFLKMHKKRAKTVTCMKLKTCSKTRKMSRKAVPFLLLLLHGVVNFITYIVLSDASMWGHMFIRVASMRLFPRACSFVRVCVHFNTYEGSIGLWLNGTVSRKSVAALTWDI